MALEMMMRRHKCRVPKVQVPRVGLHAAPSMLPPFIKLTVIRNNYIIQYNQDLAILLFNYLGIRNVLKI